jgi:2-keto-4-pentenoate hydratase/2-oxohepta-3-ene-1,7-dioic acid hydratase in catechol pathway
MIYATAAIKGETKICYIDNVGARVYPLDSFFIELGHRIPLDMVEFIEAYKADWTEAIADYFKNLSESSIPLADVCLLAPIPVPRRNIVCLGQNYADHVKELKAMGEKGEIPQHPIYFTKATHTVTGTDSAILSHSDITGALDYETELAIIIGKHGIDIPYSEAESYIFGYTIANDVSARDLQKIHNQYYKGKSLTTFCPLGPWIMHSSGIPFPPVLPMECTVNGEVRQKSSTSQLIFGISTIISDLSRGYELHPGDIILTGTPGGVGISFNPPRFLKFGDQVCCSIDGIGSLSNHVE